MYFICVYVFCLYVCTYVFVHAYLCTCACVRLTLTFFFNCCSFFKDLCICVYVSVYACLWTWAERPEEASKVLLYHSTHVPLRQGLFLNLGLMFYQTDWKSGSCSDHPFSELEFRHAQGVQCALWVLRPELYLVLHSVQQMFWNTESSFQPLHLTILDRIPHRSLPID